MRHASKLAFAIVVGLTALVLASSVDGQGLGQSPSPPVKQGHLFVAAAADYEMISAYPEMGGKLRAYDADKGILKIRFEIERAAKEHRAEYDKLQAKYKEELGKIEEKYKKLVFEQQKAYAIPKPQDRNTAMQEIGGRMKSLVGEKQTLDQQTRESMKNMEMVRDYIDFELQVDKNVQVRKMWTPQLFDDKGKPRSPTTAEKTKLKGDLKLPGYLAKLEEFEVGTPLRLKLKHRIPSLKEPEPEPAPATTTPGTAPAVPKDDPAKKEVKLEDRPLVIAVLAESDPNPPAIVPKKK